MRCFLANGKAGVGRLKVIDWFLRVFGALLSGTLAAFLACLAIGVIVESQPTALLALVSFTLLSTFCWRVILKPRGAKMVNASPIMAVIFSLGWLVTFFPGLYPMEYSLGIYIFGSLLIAAAISHLSIGLAQIGLNRPQRGGDHG